MNRFFAAGALIIILGACAKKENTPILKTGVWRATVQIQGKQLPFNFELSKDKDDGYDLFILNAEERLLVDEITLKQDSVDIALHIFDANIKALLKGDSLHGEFIKNYEKDYKLPFHAVFGQSFRFENGDQETDIHDFSGKYEVTFYNNTDTTEAIGLFKQQDDRITGTFLTATGDYRYLQGNVIDGEMNLSAFDGNHAYLFTATTLPDGKLVGKFFSGKSWQQTWIGKKNENAALPNPESLTYLKEGYDRIQFSFPDVNGTPVSLTDEKYKNKIVILQLFGTWCPNCMDETKFLSPWYTENKQRGVEIIGLAYERKDDFDYARGRVKKMIEKYKIKYDFVIAGTSDKTKAAETLPMLNTIVAFPTTIFIGRDGSVKKIHTGFSGPGTGVYYEQFVQHFNETVNELLNDKKL
jgi:thiol-disulfide isomerase/thioredoxin